MAPQPQPKKIRAEDIRLGNHAGNSMLWPALMFLGMAVIPGALILGALAAVAFFSYASFVMGMGITTPGMMLAGGALLGIGQKTGLNKHLGITPVERPPSWPKLPSLKSIFGKAKESRVIPSPAARQRDLTQYNI